MAFLFLFSPEGLIEQMTTLDSERLTQGVNNTIAAISPRLKDLHELLVNPPKVINNMCLVTQWKTANIVI